MMFCYLKMEEFRMSTKTLTNSIEHLLKTIPNNDLGNYKSVISKKEYEEFCRHYTFEALKGKSLGQSFLDRFDIPDPILSLGMSDSFCLDHILRMGYVSK